MLKFVDARGIRQIETATCTQKLCERNLAASVSLLVNDTAQNVAGDDEQNVVDVSFLQRCSHVYQTLHSFVVSARNQTCPECHDAKLCQSSS
jgi:hypothetical protein